MGIAKDIPVGPKDFMGPVSRSLGVLGTRYSEALEGAKDFDGSCRWLCANGLTVNGNGGCDKEGLLRVNSESQLPELG